MKGFARTGNFLIMMIRILSIASLSALLLTQPGVAELPRAVEAMHLIDQLDDCVQERLHNPTPEGLGMSRITIRSSLGTHFTPVLTDKRDFEPQSDRERKALAALEDRKIQVGLYLVGASILNEDSGALNFRSLKGPGAITIDTPRPKRYPSSLSKPGPWQLPVRVEDTGTVYLPDWNAIYPVAQRAMRSFKDGGKGFETEFLGWTIAARPAMAASSKCVSCHNSLAPDSVKLGEAVGGVLYAYRVPSASAHP